MMESHLLGGIFRLIHVTSQAAPTILVGLFVAGIFRRMLGHDHTRRLFGGESWRSLPQAWALGMLLPVCSLGVIPVIREMRKAGLSGGVILAFAISAPLFNPISFLYGLTLSKPLVIIAFALCSLAIVTVVGSIWDRMFPGTGEREPEPKPVPAGLKRMISVLATAVREAASSTVVFLAIGIGCSAFLALILPNGALQRTMNGDNWLAPLSMTGLSIPAYATPMLAMSQVGSMFQHANSPGAAFVLLTLGAGMNLGLFGWLMRQYGWRRAVVWLALTAGIVLALAYGVNGPLYPMEVDPADHTHAFDIYCNPFHTGDPHAWSKFTFGLRETMTRFDWYGIVALAAFVVAGFILKTLDPQGKLEAWLEQQPPEESVEKGWDIVIPVPVLTALMMLGLMVLSVAGCFIYFPPKAEVFSQITVVRAEALYFVNVKDSRRADHWFALWDDLTRRLEVGVFLRDGQLTEYQHTKARVFREKLELLRHAVEDHDDAEIAIYRPAVVAADRRLRKAFLGDAPGP